MSAHRGGQDSGSVLEDTAGTHCGNTAETVTIWDAETGQELLTLTGHAKEVCGAAYSPNGKRGVSGGSDRTVKVWELSSLDKSRQH